MGELVEAVELVEAGAAAAARLEAGAVARLEAQARPLPRQRLEQHRDYQDRLSANVKL